MSALRCSSAATGPRRLEPKGQTMARLVGGIVDGVEDFLKAKPWSAAC